MALKQFTNLLHQFTADDGSVLAGGKVYFYLTGTTTNAAIYSDSAGTAAANPVVLDSAGRFPTTNMIYGDVIITYKIVVKTSADVAVGTALDPIRVGDVLSSTTYLLSDYASLSAAVTAIGATEATLVLDADDTVSTTVTVPSTLSLQPMNGNIITYSGTLTINGPIVAGDFHWLTKSGSGTISITRNTVSAAWWGLPDDNATDASAQFNACIASGAKRIRISKPTSKYLLTAPVNMTALRGVIFDCEGGSDFNLPPFRIAHTGIGFDLSESFDLRFYDFSYDGDDTTVPSVGMFLARNAAGASAGRHRFYNCASTGQFSVAPLYMYGSEENSFYSPQLQNDYAGAARCVVITANNINSISSTFITVATGGISNIVNHFYAPSFLCVGNGGSQLETAVYLESAGNVTFESPFTYTPNGKANITVDLTNGTSDFIRIKNWRGEINTVATKPDYGIFVGNEAARTLADWEVDGQCDSVDEVLYLSDNASMNNLRWNGVSCTSGKAISSSNIYDSDIKYDSNSVTVRSGRTAARNVFIGYGSALSLLGTDTTNHKIDTLASTGTFTPELTCATPGDLSVAYATQTGYYAKHGDSVTVTIAITTSTWTHTTASGGLKITGLTGLDGLANQFGALATYSGFTSSGFESLSVQMVATEELYLNKSGSGVANTSALVTDFPTAGIVVLNLSFTYRLV